MWSAKVVVTALLFALLSLVLLLNNRARNLSGITQSEWSSALQICSFSSSLLVLTPLSELLNQCGPPEKRLIMIHGIPSNKSKSPHAFFFSAFNFSSSSSGGLCLYP